MECQEDPDVESTGSSYQWNSDYWYDTPIKYSCPHGQAFEGQDKRVMYGNCTFQSGDTEKVFWRFNSTRQLPNCVGKEKCSHVCVFHRSRFQRIASASSSHVFQTVPLWFTLPTATSLAPRPQSLVTMGLSSLRLQKTRPLKFQPPPPPQPQQLPRVQQQRLQQPQPLQQQHLFPPIVLVNCQPGLHTEGHVSDMPALK